MLKRNAFMLLLALAALAGCQRGPSPELIASIEEGIERYQEKHDTFKMHLDHIRGLQDTLFYDQLLQTLSERGKERFIVLYKQRPEELPNNLPRFDLLKEEYEENLHLYRAFLQEYKLSLKELENWREGLPASDKTHEAVRQQWEQYKRELNRDIERDQEIMQQIRQLRQTYQQYLERLRRRLRQMAAEQ
jgi:chromosome segregation ATPase